MDSMMSTGGFSQKCLKKKKCDINIHGHVHSMKLGDKRCINASFEAIGFKPVRLGVLLQRYLQRMIEKLDG
jgi:calcineurin-like phosphoesterase family protein